MNETERTVKAISENSLAMRTYEKAEKLINLVEWHLRQSRRGDAIALIQEQLETRGRQLMLDHEFMNAVRAGKEGQGFGVAMANKTIVLTLTKVIENTSYGLRSDQIILDDTTIKEQNDD